MAKQKGIHKIQGKVGDMSYMYSKSAGGYILREINPGMSERVKSAPEYVNTRKNATEFGASGALAGALVRNLSQRWRYILNPVTTGMMAKRIKAEMAQGTGDWGKRELSVASALIIAQALSSYSKNELPDDFLQVGHTAEYDSDSTSYVLPSISLPEGWGADLAAKGADGLLINVILTSTSIPKYDEQLGGYTSPSRMLFSVSTSKYPIGADDTWDKNPTVPAEMQSVAVTSADNISGAAVVFLPYRTINNQDVILQEHCSFRFLAGVAGA